MPTCLIYVAAFLFLAGGRDSAAATEPTDSCALLGSGAVLSLQPPPPSVWSATTNCSCGQFQNARRICPVRRCRVSDPSVLQGFYVSKHCTSDAPHSRFISFMNFYCRETVQHLRVFEFAGLCGNYSVFKPATRTVRACGLEEFVPDSETQQNLISDKLNKLQQKNCTDIPTWLR